MRETRSSFSKIEWVIAGVICLEVLYLFYCNIIHIPDNIESDIAKMMEHTMEMAAHKTLFLHDWIYTTTAEWDSVALPAIIIYLITNNIFFSYGIVNCANIVLFSAVVVKLLRQDELERPYRMLALAVLYGLYDMDDIWYTSDMLFTAGAQYIYKVMMPLLFLAVLTIPEKERRRTGNVIWMILFLFLTSLTAMSSGVYVWLCGLLPVILCLSCYFFFDYYQCNQSDNRSFKWTIWQKKYQSIIIAVTIIATVSGLMLCRVLHVNPGSSTKMDLRTLSEVAEQPFRTFSTFLQIWSLFPMQPVPVMSLRGMAMAVKFILISALLLFGFYGFRCVFGRGLEVRSCLMAVFAWNYTILFLTYSTPRYQLMGAIPLMLCAIYALRDLLEKPGFSVAQTGVFAIILSSLLLIGVASIDYSERVHFHKLDALKTASKSLKEDLDRLGIKTVIWLNGREMAEIMRLYDESPDRLYTNMVVPPEGDYYAFNWNTYYPANDRSGYNDYNAIIATAESFERMPYYVRNTYKKHETDLPVHAGSYIDAVFNIYLADTCPVDGSSGLPRGTMAIDLPCSAGYKVNGIINSGGELETSEQGLVYESVGLFLADGESASLELRYILEADEKSDPIYAEIVDGDGSVVETIHLGTERDVIKTVISGPHNHRIRVYQNGNSRLRIGELIMTRL